MQQRSQSLFPYSPRKSQPEIMGAIGEALSTGKHLIMESCTGSGKTATVLAPAIEYALGHGKRILYLTRTNAQQRQVIIEFRKIRDKITGYDPDAIGHKGPIPYCIGLQGRRSMCLLAKDEPELLEGSADELGKICRDRKNRTLECLKASGRKMQEWQSSGGLHAEGTCPHFAGTCACDRDEIIAYIREKLPFAEEFLGYCRERGLCAHELNKELASGAILITAPYIYFLDNFMRISLLDEMQCAISDLIVIVDEAHNLPEYARTLRSHELSQLSVQLARSEASEFDDPEIADGIRCSFFCEEVLRLLIDIAQEYVRDEDGIIPPDELESELMHSFSFTSRKLEVAVENIVVLGETIRERRRASGKLPRSFVHSLGSFLFFWLKLDTERYVRLVVGGANPRLEGYCLDPSLATDIFNAVHSSVHMSGTLRPLEEYRDSIGLPPDSVLREFPSPFPEGNLAVFYTKNITTKYELLPKNLPLLRKELSAIISSTKKNTAIFFPSFDMMGKAGSVDTGKVTVIREDRELGQEELLLGIEKFRGFAGKGEGAVLMAVTGGRLSEGLDFPDRELEVVIIAGVPYPKPTARQAVLQLYYDMKFNRGWEYTVTAPTARKLMQAIGRMIRSEKDRGIAVILDSRAAHFKEFIKKLKPTEDPAGEICKFKFV